MVFGRERPQIRRIVQSCGTAEARIVDRLFECSFSTISSNAPLLPKCTCRHVCVVRYVVIDKNVLWIINSSNHFVICKCEVTVVRRFTGLMPNSYRSGNFFGWNSDRTSAPPEAATEADIKGCPVQS